MVIMAELGKLPVKERSVVLLYPVSGEFVRTAKADCILG